MKNLLPLICLTTSLLTVPALAQSGGSSGSGTTGSGTGTSGSGSSTSSGRTTTGDTSSSRSTTGSRSGTTTGSDTTTTDTNRLGTNRMETDNTRRSGASQQYGDSAQTYSDTNSTGTRSNNASSRGVSGQDMGMSGDAKIGRVTDTLRQARLQGSEIIGMGVRGPGNEEIASISDIEFGPRGDVTAYYFERGGFLGVGSEVTRIPARSVMFTRNEEGDGFIARVDQSVLPRLLSREEIADIYEDATDDMNYGAYDSTNVGGTSTSGSYRSTGSADTSRGANSSGVANSSGARMAMSEDEFRQNLRQALRTDREVMNALSDIDIEWEDDTVTLSGRVPSEQAAQRLLQMARQMTNKRIVNELDVAS